MYLAMHAFNYLIKEIGIVDLPLEIGPYLCQEVDQMSYFQM